MMKSFRKCLDSIFWVFPVFYFVLDPVLYLIMLIGMAVVLVYVFLMILFCILLDAIIGYENLGEYGSNDRDYEYLIEEFTEQYR